MKYDFKTKEGRKRFYKSKFWRGVNGVRNKVVERDKECVWCKEKGLTTVTKLEVDHRIPLEECTWEEAIDPNNLRCLCRSCHNFRHDRFDGVKSKAKQWDDEKW